MQDKIAIGDQAFLKDGGEEFGSVRGIHKGGVVLYVENAGEFEVPFAAVKAVHFGKVIFHAGKLDERLRQAIGHAHDAED